MAADDWSVVTLEGNPATKWGALPLIKTSVKVGDQQTITAHAVGDGGVNGARLPQRTSR